MDNHINGYMGKHLCCEHDGENDGEMRPIQGPAPGLCDFPEGSAKCCVQELPPPTVRAPGF